MHGGQTHAGAAPDEVLSPPFWPQAASPPGSSAVQGRIMILIDGEHAPT